MLAKISHIKNKLQIKFNSLIKTIKQIYLNQSITPNAVYIEPTNICNANCIFCAYQFYDATKEIMSFDMLNKVLEQSKNCDVKHIGLTPFAGEILADKQIIKKIKMIDEYKFKKVHTYTNLLFLNRFDVDEFLNSGITELFISTAPLDKDLYNKIFRVNKYDTFISNLETLLTRFNSIKSKTIKKISIDFRGNLKLKDCLDLPDYVDKIKKLINKNINVTAMTKFDSWMGVINSNDLLDGMTICEQNGKKYIPCSRLNNIQILSNGDIRICGCRFNNLAKKDVFNLGNIDNISILDAYNSDIVKNLKKSFLLNSPPIECQKCSWYC